MSRQMITAIAVIVLLILVNTTLFTVDQREQAIIIQLGRPIRVIKEPGLHAKVPFVQQVTRFDNRLLDYDAAAKEVITKDKKNLKVDNFAKWRITDPLRFLQTVRNEDGAQSRLDDIIYSELRLEMGLKDLIEIVSTQRSAIMAKVTARSNEKAAAYGIEIRDVRIKRADLPVENEKAVFGRMQAERQRIAKQYRAEGQEEAVKIRSETDKLKVILLAEAYEKEQKIRGEGDATAVKTYAQALQADPDFYAFLRSLEVYKKSFKDKTSVILSPQSDLLKYLKGTR